LGNEPCNISRSPPSVRSEIEIVVNPRDSQTGRSFPRQAWILQGCRRQFIGERSRFLGTSSTVNAPRRWAIEIQLLHQADVLTVDCTGDFRLVALNRSATEQSARLELELVHGLSIGTKRGILLVSAQSGGVAVPPVELKVEAEITRDVISTPPEIALGGGASQWRGSNFCLARIV
jgi:hypothetical protein